MIHERWWLVGAFLVTLAGASIATWTADGPRLATASAASRHRVPAQRGEAIEALRGSAPEPPAPVEPPPPPLRRARRQPGHISIEVRDLPEVPDLPEPGPQYPLLWDDLFPAPPRPATGTAPPARTPCFDHLQGIEGLSPCPAATPR